MSKLNHVVKRTVETDVRPELEPVLNSFDKEMSRILTDETLTDYDKWLLYTNTLSQYTSVLKTQQRPQKHVITEETEPTTNIELSEFRTGIREKVRKLLLHVPDLKANEEQELILPHRGVIKDSNYINIFTDMFTDVSSRAKPPIGRSATINFLREHAPLLPDGLLVNKKYKQLWIHY